MNHALRQNRMIVICFTLFFTLSCGYEFKKYRLDGVYQPKIRDEVELLNLTPFPSLERALQHTISSGLRVINDDEARICSIRRLSLSLRDSQRFNDITLSELVDLRLIATVTIYHRSLKLIEHEVVLISPSSGEDMESGLYPHVERLARRIILRLQDDCERLSHETNKDTP